MSRLVSFALLFGLLAGTAAAATYAVDRHDDEPTATACTAALNDCSLRGAILKVNAGAGGDTVALGAGTYVLTVQGAAEDDGATGDLDVKKSVTITGLGSAQTIVDAGGLDPKDGIHQPDRALHIDPYGGGTLVVQITGVTIQKGNTTGIAFVRADGAGIMNGNARMDLHPNYDLGSAVGLTDVVVKDCTSTGRGVGIANLGTMTIDHGVIEHNTGIGAQAIGGGIMQGDAEANTLQMTDTIVRFNQAQSGGGLYNGVFNHADLTIPKTTIVRSTFHDNTAVGVGGGIFQDRGQVTVIDSTISHNAANNPSFSAAGLHANAPPGIVLKNATVAFNVGAGLGGGISGSVTLSNTIVAGNTGGANPDCTGTPISGGYNLVETATGCTAILAADATTLTGVSPNLQALASNGGTTPTHQLTNGSPAIDHGHPGAPGSGGGACEATDQRGVARPVGVRCDIGAYEGGLPPTTTTSTTSSTTTTTTTKTTTSSTTTTTAPPACGNGHLDAGEACDGDALSDTVCPGAADQSCRRCTSDCTLDCSTCIPTEVDSFILPTRLRVKANAKDPARSMIVAAGIFDTGSQPVTLGAAAALRVGSLDAAVVAPQVAHGGFRLQSDGFLFVVTPSKIGSSKARFKMKWQRDLTGAVNPEAPLTIRFEDAAVDGRGTVRLAGGAYQLRKRPGVLVEPTLFLARARAHVAGAGKDTLALQLGLATDGQVPPAAPDVTLGFGSTWAVSIPGSAFAVAGSRFTATAGDVRVTLDYGRELLTVQAKHADLGAFDAGVQPVRVAVTLGADHRANDVRMVRKGATLRY